MSLPIIDHEKDATPEEIKMLISYGWEISEDQHDARLYSEEWSSIQAAIWSTKGWIEDNRPERPTSEIAGGKA